MSKPDKLQKALMLNSPLLFGGAIGIAIGGWLIFDDVNDFGEGIRTTPGYFPLHHFHLGVIALLIGIVLTCLGILFVLLETL